MGVAVVRIHTSPGWQGAIIVIPSKNSFIPINVKNQMIYCVWMIWVNVLHDLRNGLHPVQRNAEFSYLICACTNVGK